MLKEKLTSELSDKRIAILGFGKEGRSTFRLLREIFPKKELHILDEKSLNEWSPDSNTVVYDGLGIYNRLNEYDSIFKSPGVSVRNKIADGHLQNITSQAEQFIASYRNQIIGVTGTKGKSTTTTLIHNVLKKSQDFDVLIAGNIGVPFFDVVDQIGTDTLVVCELSCHHLERLTCSPRISVVLNYFEEHLDYYKTFQEYITAKSNIYRWQNATDHLIFNNEDKRLVEQISRLHAGQNLHSVSSTEDLGILLKAASSTFIRNQTVYAEGAECSSIIDIKNSRIPGHHNDFNLAISASIANLFGVDRKRVGRVLNSFPGLTHRLEYVNQINGIEFYNDSISTAQESVIAALNSLRNVEALILGGKDRGIRYDELVEHLINNPISNLYLVGAAGGRIGKLIASQPDDLQSSIHFMNDLPTIISNVIETLPPKTTCLLSPGAASHDQYKDFEERGEMFKNAVNSHILP